MLSAQFPQYMKQWKQGQSNHCPCFLPVYFADNRHLIANLVDTIRRKQNSFAFLALAVITLIGAGFRFSQIGKQPLWMDEAFSVWMSRHSIPDIIKLTITIDQHPPLYHILLHLWNSLGGYSEVWVRTFSALLSVLTILAIYLLGKTLAGSRVGLLSALAFAFSPFQVQYAQEARGYSLLTLSACLSMWATARLLICGESHTLTVGDQFKSFFRQSKTPSLVPDQTAGSRAAAAKKILSAVDVDLTWVGYMIFTALAVYAHNTAVFLPFGINLFVFGLILYRRRFPAVEGQLQAPSLKNWLIAQFGAFLFWSPWLVSFYYQMIGVVDNFWIQPPTVDLALNTLKTFLLAWVPDRLNFQWLIWVMFGGLFFLALLKCRAKLGHFFFLAALFLTPFLGELLVSLRRPIFYDRTLIWCTIPLYVLVAFGISQLRFRSYILTALTIFITLNLLSLSNYFTYFEKERWDLAAQYVNTRLQQGDIIIFNANWAEIPFDYYFAPYNRKIEEFGAPETMFEFGVLEPRMAAKDLPRLRSIIHGRKRVWLVYSHNWWTDPKSLIPAELGKSLRLTKIQLYNGIQIQLFQEP